MLIPLDIYFILHPMILLMSSEHLRRSTKALFIKKASEVVPNTGDATNYAGIKGGSVSNLGEGAGNPLKGKTKSRAARYAVEYKMNPDSNVKITEQMWENGKIKQ